MTKVPLRLVGGLGSPYTMKMRAILRYRRIPHMFQMRNGVIAEEVAHVKPRLIPMLKFPDDEGWRVDSTPMAYELEARYEDDRSIVPTDPAQRFLSDLIEDFADEWLTKAMFHYRWYYAADRDFSSGWIAADNVLGPDGQAARKAFATRICERQVSRMSMVGCTDENRAAIERSFEMLIDRMEPAVGFGQFLFGTRPSLADFGLFGQLKTLSDDPTGQQIMRQRAPTLVHWIRQVDDLSGVDGAWHEGDIPAVVKSIVSLSARTYLPFMQANLDALQSGAEKVRLELLGETYEQAPFRYQGKTYTRLKSLYEQLTGAAREQVDSVLDAVDAKTYFTSA